MRQVCLQVCTGWSGASEHPPSGEAATCFLLCTVSEGWLQASPCSMACVCCAVAARVCCAALQPTMMCWQSPAAPLSGQWQQGGDTSQPAQSWVYEVRVGPRHTPGCWCSLCTHVPTAPPHAADQAARASPSCFLVCKKLALIKPLCQGREWQCAAAIRSIGVLGKGVVACHYTTPACAASTDPGNCNRPRHPLVCRWWESAAQPPTDAWCGRLSGGAVAPLPCARHGCVSALAGMCSVVWVGGCICKPCSGLHKHTLLRPSSYAVPPPRQLRCRIHSKLSST